MFHKRKEKRVVLVRHPRHPSKKIIILVFLWNIPLIKGHPNHLYLNLLIVLVAKPIMVVEKVDRFLEFLLPPLINLIQNSAKVGTEI